MKICAIICEYNPLHNGHKMQIQKSREITGADYILCIMSGNFTQRGEASILDKYQRASLAISAGADAVIELPQQFASSSAEVFALGAVKCLNSLKCVTHLCFGSESGDIENLNYAAQILSDEPPELKSLIMQNLKLGISHSASKIKATKQHFENNEALNDIVNKSNNILAVEYLRALITTKSSIIPLTIKREGSDYNDKEFKKIYASASAIREILYSKSNIKSVEKFVPKECYNKLKENKIKNNFPNINLFNNLILFKLKTISEQELKNTFSVNEGLENYIIKSAKQSKTYEEFLSKTVTKRYGVQKIKRIALHALLEIKKESVMEVYNDNFTPSYLKVLAANDSGILSKLADSFVPIITRSKDTEKLSRDDEIIKLHERAHNIFNMLICDKPDYIPDILRSAEFIKTIQ